MSGIRESVHSYSDASNIELFAIYIALLLTMSSYAKYH